VLIIHFEFASSRVRISEDAEQALLEAARKAPWIFLRGRTDGLVENLADGRLARSRAQAVQDLLISRGIDAARIRTTHQATGDPLILGTDESGRSLSRRVEVELYTAAPSPATPIN
jgi:outer membrane protein OmpA-like peptidoglycan-associated protein